MCVIDTEEAAARSADSRTSGDSWIPVNPSEFRNQTFVFCRSRACALCLWVHSTPRSLSAAAVALLLACTLHFSVPLDVTMLLGPPSASLVCLVWGVTGVWPASHTGVWVIHFLTKITCPIAVSGSSGDTASKAVGGRTSRSMQGLRAQDPTYQPTHEVHISPRPALRHPSQVHTSQLRE